MDFLELLFDYLRRLLRGDIHGMELIDTLAIGGGLIAAACLVSFLLKRKR